MKKASLKKLFLLLSTTTVASIGVLGLTQSKQANNNATNYSDSNDWSTQSFASSTVQSAQTKATAYFEKTVFEGTDSFNYINVTLPINPSEISDLNLDSLFISFTLSHPNASNDNVMYFGYKDRVDAMTNSTLPTKVSLEKGKYNEQSKTYTLTVKFSGMYAWDLSTFKFQLGLDERTIEIKPTNKPQPKPIYQSRAATPAPKQPAKAKKRSRRSLPKASSPLTQKSFNQMSDADLLKLAANVQQYHAPAKPQWKPAISDVKIIPIQEDRSASFRSSTTNHYISKNFVTLNPSNEYLNVLDHSKWTGFVANVPVYQVAIPNEYKFLENGARKFYLNMNISDDNRSSTVSYVVDGHKATLIRNYGSNKQDISMFEKTYIADDKNGLITFQIRIGKNFDPAKSRLTMSFTGFRNGTYFQIPGTNKNVKVKKLNQWEQNEVWNRGTWNKYVTVEGSEKAKEGDKITVELKHPDAPDTTLHYIVKGNTLIPYGNDNGNSIKFNIYQKGASQIQFTKGNKIGFYVELSSLFDPTKAEITVQFNNHPLKQVVTLPNFWNMFPSNY